MKMNDCVLLYIDQKRRDTLAIILVYKYLRHHGINVVLSSSSDFFMKYLYFRPKIVLQAHPDSYHGDWTRFMSQYSIVCSLPTEQQMSDPDQLTKRIVGGHNPDNKNYEEPFIEGISTFYLWSEEIFRILNKDSKFNSKLKIVGNPRVIDNRFLRGKAEKKKNRDAITIGIALENELNNRNVSEFLHAMRNYEFNEFGSVENFCAVNIHITKEITAVFHAIYSTRSDVNFIIRPRLDDNGCNYKFLVDNYRNVTIDTSESPFVFFNQIDCLILAQSSIGTEAQMAGIPVISVYGLMQETLNYYNIEQKTGRLSHYWMPKDFPELNVLLDKIKENVLEVSRNVDEFKAYVSRYYISENQKQHPSYLISNDLKLKLEDFSMYKPNVNESYTNEIFFKKLLPAKLCSEPFSGFLLRAFFRPNFPSNFIMKMLVTFLGTYYYYQSITGKNENYYIDLFDPLKKYSEILDSVENNFNNQL